MSSRWEATADLVVVGTGVAGLSAALEATRAGLRVVVVTKAEADAGNTRWAQGGVAVVLPGQHEPGDSVRRHVDDTLVAGAGLCDPAAVATILADGPEAVAGLRTDGAVFDPAGDDQPGRHGLLALAREGGHTAFRVVHAGGDATGAEVERALLAGVRNQRLTLLERHVAARVLRTEAGTVAGLLVLADDGVAGVLRAPAVLLATGGLGQLYETTTNPDVATADGIALALRAGASVADLEFVQFHPTVLYPGRGATGSRPLVTEAVRGEGAVLVDAAGERVMAGVHPLEDLAPRDVVSAAIIRRLADVPGGVDDHVFLDATHLKAEAFRARFPTVYAACRAIGVDPSSEPIPVAPSAHFSCGGVVTTVDGRTGVPGLYAAGEVARTGLHGANRLASNSLLEGLVVGRRAAKAVVADLSTGLAARRSASRADDAAGALEAEPVADRPGLQQLMSRHAAIGRDQAGLAIVTKSLDAMAASRVRPAGRADVEDAALHLAARALVLAASTRTESRGCHVRHDHLVRDDQRWRRSLVVGLDTSGEPTLLPALDLGGVA
ncbi:L-aspartate oxidase [Actinopolymorpha cephalotaxi]|uniref:L-aspartate oxidase n=1 Tax=Actinopolymorpha cephalotaxi TaxID=504797 RepID=A0A1I2R2W9_9ACTN|nr:L-aspartate oxidase [Actinopolymorpha cephalotaxi]NYH82442.1 L-aspartate oxidase [Actinopolymorpha cephalotaxi]SFG32927.1 L-aspartate oxidase [Actinopolymorpha cephalotaxi]